MSGVKQRVGSILSRHKPSLADRWGRAVVEDNLQAVSLYWKRAIGAATAKDTIEVCTHLDSTMDEELWYSHFEVVVVPLIIELDLPAI